MEAYKFETTISEDGKIILPQSMKNLFAHTVELILLDKEERKPNPVEFLSKLVSEYNQIDEKDIDITELYKKREKINARQISFD